MRALTLMQPWATFMMMLGDSPGLDKDVENRPMAPPLDLIGKRFAVHAGLKFDDDDAWGLMDRARQSLPPMEFPRGCLLGTLELVGFVRFTPSPTPSDPWEGGRAEGLTREQVVHVALSRWRAPSTKACWLVRNPLMLPQPLPCKGALGLWRVPADLVRPLERLEEMA
jgi:hypothetical protein